ncbi:regulator of nucleoside diphosphate kinase [Sphingomonas naasensis]|uniref:Nucleoside diphosphate kinase regulator n=1 Tax=Sphingomonas naasensis TaxID=1344951 RepID=A0A4S1WN04_9SPHN|nr:nucleoside diphosphate kinase regulator [Sphingomonas naasensis]NIJ21780.1 regulator of nucleoside diphosphate kinase [Sphingomonas naasensis]TGX42516.1 nucleoside diphosphate kinase regulator [Sphingomonas naasensis]
MNTQRKAASRPPIHMIDAEAEMLADLALSVERRMPAVSALLLREAGRARLHRAADIPGDVVTMGSRVEFVDETHGVPRTVTLVYPCEADISEGRISILTPVGAALIGLRAGQSIFWPDRILTVFEVRHP